MLKILLSSFDDGKEETILFAFFAGSESIITWMADDSFGKHIDCKI